MQWPLRAEVRTAAAISCGVLWAAFLGGDCGSYCALCPPPMAFAMASTTRICAGEPVVLTGGPNHCAWSPATAVVTPFSCTTMAFPTENAVFTVTAEDSFRPNCFVSASVAVEVVKSAAPTISAPSVVFANQTGLTATVPSHEGSLYEWSIFDGTITAGQGTNAITFSAGPGPVRISLFEVGLGLEVIEYPSGDCRSEKAQVSIPFAAGQPPPAPTPTPTPRTRTLPFRP
jgi:hypothetical protein